MFEIKISRWLGFNQHFIDTEFHVFVDASSDAYGAVCYVRHVYGDKSVKVCFVLSRGRVAPLKCMTVPKLEVMAAAAVGLKVGKTVSPAMNCSLKCFYFWSDSMNVLWWIRGYSKSFKPFVAHHVGQIQSNTSPDQWNYVNTERNPADIISRGSNVRCLKTNSLWLNGLTICILINLNGPKLRLNHPSMLKNVVKIMILVFVHFCLMHQIKI